MNHRFRILLASLVILSMHSYSQEEDKSEEKTEEKSETEESIVELLEFLGEFETESGDWVSPFDLLQDRHTELDKPKTNDDENDEND